MIFGKTWGSTEPLLQNHSVELHRISFKKGMQCSMHKHEHKHNLFFVLDGYLRIVVKKNDYDLTDEIIIGPGEFTSVKPGEYHRFIGESAGAALELYWVDPLDIDDISREDVGGSVANARIRNDERS